VINGPGINNWDIGAEKSFVLAREATRVQLRAEMFNAWNHTQFDQPNGNARRPELRPYFHPAVRHA
jgi:hypothetical protein